MTRPLLFALLLVFTLPTAAQDIVPDQPAPTAPATPVAPTPLPAGCEAPMAKAFDGGLDPRIPPDCDSTAYYYGIGRDKDVQMARACALIERINHVDKDGSLFTGPGILSMTFANGEGGPRDIETAKRFVCENKEASTAEMEARLKFLDRMAENPKDTGRFDICRTASTGTSVGWCTSLQLRINDARRYTEMVKIVDGLPPAAIDAFKALQTAEGNFESLHTDKEIDQTGTARGALILQEQDRLRALFVSDLKLFNKPDFSEPVTLTVVQAHVDDELAAVQKKGPANFRGTTLSVTGVLETQNAWQKYRDAWTAYEAIVNPKVSSDAVATQLERERLYDLHKLANTF